MSDNLLSDNINYSVYDKLDWNSIVSIIASSSIFEITKDYLKIFPTAKSVFEINQEYECLDFFIKNHTDYSPLISKALALLPTSKDPFNSFEKFKKNIFTDKDSLNFCCKLIESLLMLPKDVQSFELLSGDLWQSYKQNKPLKIFKQEFRSLIDSNGRINYSYHPDLSKLFHKLLKLDSEIKSELSKISRSGLFKNALQYTEHDILHDRYVLAVKSDSYQGKLGSIIAHSSSGLTLYVEPSSIRSLDDKRIELEYKIEEFLNKKFIEFGQIINKDFILLNRIKECLISLDVMNSKAEFSLQQNFCKPELSENYEINIQDFFHPILDKPIVNHLVLDDENRGLVISGPNTGGKTVALKALTLCHLFLHYGLYIPARKALLRPVSSIYFFSHDNQDINQGLSSFSSEANGYLKLLDEVEDHSLVVIDEIFNSTSSEEASALATGILQQILTKNNTRVFLSTHHKILKTNLYKSDSFLSAHVGFNEHTHSPTYKLIFGEPGASLALNIFQILSNEFKSGQKVLEIAQDSLEQNETEYEELLGELTLKSQRLDKLITENNKKNFDLENSKNNLEHQLSLKTDQAYKAYKEKLDKSLKKVESYYFEMKKRETAPSKNRLNQDIADFKHSLNSLDENIKSKNKDHLNRGAVTNFKIGSFYFSEKFHKDVKLLNINHRKKLYQISSGKISSWVNADDLYLTKTKQQEAIAHITRQESSQIEYDVRGMRLDDFKSIAIPAIDGLLSEDIPFLNIIHGHGDGVLKKWLRNYLKSLTELNWDHPEGNDGITRIQLA
jgi:DNA mismatch repair protein MutS2